MAQSYYVDDSSQVIFNTGKVGYSAKLRGIEIATTTSDLDIDGKLRVGSSTVTGTTMNTGTVNATRVNTDTLYIDTNWKVEKSSSVLRFLYDSNPVFTINTSSVSLGASGSNTCVMFNDSKNFGFDANFYYDKTTGTLYANNVNVQSITGLDLTFDDIDGTLEASRISGLTFSYEDLEGIPVASAPTSIVVAEIAAPIESNSLYPTFFTETASVEGSSSTPYTAPGIVFDSFTGTLSVTVLTQTSDASMKYDVNRINNATDKLTKLNGVDYRWKNNSTMGSGVIAQELQTILPHLVHSDSNGQLSVNYNGLSGYIIETLKEINERLKRLENQ